LAAVFARQKVLGRDMLLLSSDYNSGKDRDRHWPGALMATADTGKISKPCFTAVVNWLTLLLLTFFSD